ncbi:hypothetical protein [Cryptosporidium parvum Iowa II]|uniref:Uncharacterized protein n=2 Tax=Cryptosporidium parvum TaxID=5807 RepID=A0A7S7LDK3_CRYPV|nr:hypothetical protein [Cryptosporidium parvum Iowa II]EAK89456.1 hypothetical secreted protein, signal peptide [Cryptosporidium parvum Iowa II]QOY40025.1 Uncharacterized protein CPATCC_0002800 [Cryptosporidium parvum]WKS79522.1 signal peptide-containing protein [Cryptosporidium sp. 43IA8]WRK34023.1 Uncharacterized protein cpbgf_8002680 [Cryptosporidium parvum]|eukprot:QOY40025.1 hypothetical protein CPATCC_004094 [Cryptosporidium parvum]
MKNLKYKFLLFIAISLLFISKVKSSRIIYLDENATRLESNATEPISNNKFPYLPNISNDTFNNMQENIIKAVVGFDSFIFDIAKNITSGMRIAQFFILNKTKTFILPFVMFPDEKSFENFKNSTSNETEVDNLKLEKLFPININLLSPNKSNFTNSTLEETLIKPEMLIPYLRGSHKTIRYNDTTNENLKNFTTVNSTDDSEKIINSTLIRLNKYLLTPNNGSLNINNQTSRLRFLQFTSAYGLEDISDQQFGQDLNYLDGIPNVGGISSFAQDYDQWIPSNNFDFYNGYGFDFLFME